MHKYKSTVLISIVHSLIFFYSLFKVYFDKFLRKNSKKEKLERKKKVYLWLY